MYENNEDIDKPREKWKKEEIEDLFVFCILDRGIPYRKVCEVFKTVKWLGLTRFDVIFNRYFNEIAYILKFLGHRWWNKTAGYLKENVKKYSAADLYEMSREELKNNIKGFGYKLASMFHNRLHPEKEQYAIIDRHIDKYLKEQGCTAKSYLEKEKYMMKLARGFGMSIGALDWKIWEERRVKY